MENYENPAGESTSPDDEYYKGDEFRMSCMKVTPCAKKFVHDWTTCVFSHPQEKARRRDPKLHEYTGIACPSMKKEGSCAFGDHCPYAHNVFEYWLHPTRYRTQLCNDGSNCRRTICFFAHSLDELRVPACKPFVSPERLAAAAAAAAADDEARRRAGLGPVPPAAAAAGRGLSPSPFISAPSPVSVPRLSVDSTRQSSEWGPVPMPATAGSDSVPSSPSQSSPKSGEQLSGSPQAGEGPSTAAGAAAGGDSRFSVHEQQVIESVTAMLAQDRLTASQAATILQQMLPATSLALLQSRLGLIGAPAPPHALENAPEDSISRRAISDPLGLRRGSGSSLEQMAAMQAFQSSGHRCVASPSRVSMEMGSNRVSMESARSSFDTARYSFDGRRGSVDSAFGSARGSFDIMPAAPPLLQQQQAYVPPAPAYPQYWTGQQLTTVPEGFPMAANRQAAAFGAAPAWPTPVRHSTGNAPSPNDPSVAARLSADLARMSFEQAQAPEGDGASSAVPAVNPYASAFFGGSGGGGPSTENW